MGDRRLCIVTFAMSLCLLFSLPLATLYPLMTSNHLSGTALHASIVEFAYAGGTMLCAAMVSLHGEIRDKFRVIHFALLGTGIASLLCGILPASLSFFWMFAVLCAILGACGNLYYIPHLAYLQQTVLPEAQGRVFSLIGSLLSVSMPLGLILAGPVAERYGVALWFFITGWPPLPACSSAPFSCG